MKLVDNFDILADHINFDESDKKYVLIQMVRRRKDHPDSKNERSLATYYIRSREHLLRLKPEIIALSELYGARVYINLSPKSFKKLQEDVAQELLRKVIDGEVDNPAHVTKSLAAKQISKEPWWMLDVDDAVFGDETHINVINWLLFYNVSLHNIVTIPSLTGLHILVNQKFNSYEFERRFPEIGLKKNAMGALLYYNSI